MLCRQRRGLSAARHSPAMTLRQGDKLIGNPIDFPL
jgi:hypothetical protein